MSPDAPRASDSATVVAFLLLVVIAGGNAPAIREVSCDGCELAPFWAASLRFLVAAVIFAVLARALSVAVPSGRALLGVALFGMLQFGAGFGLIYWGFERAPAGLGQVILASVPLLTLGLALLHRQERFTWEGAAGAGLAAGGIAVVFGSGVDADVPLSSMVAILAGAFCWAEALVVAKRFPAVHPAAANMVAMGVGSAVLLVAAAVAGEPHDVPGSRSTLLAQGYLVVAGSVGVFWLYIVVLRGWTASAASYQMVLIPLVTLVISAWLQDERITIAFAGGSLLVLVAVYVGAVRPMRDRR